MQSNWEKKYILWTQKYLYFRINKEEYQSEIRRLQRERDIIKEDIVSFHERSNVLNKRFEYQETASKDELEGLKKKIDEK